MPDALAISSYNTTLSSATAKDGEFEKVVPIKDFSDLIGDPNTLETTDLDQDQQTFIPGIKSGDTLQFTVNYLEANMNKLKLLEGKNLYWKLKLQDESYFVWGGSLTVGVPGKGVDEVLEITLNIVPFTGVEYVPKTPTV